MAEKKAPLKIMQGSIFLKIIVIIGIFLIASALLFGMPFELSEMVWTGIRILAGILLLFLVFKGIQAAIKPKPFSPTESFSKKIIRVAIKSKPFNVKELYIRGEDMRVYSKWGKIAGLLFIPYLHSRIKYDKQGNIQLVQKIDKDGHKVFDENNKPVMVPAREIMTEKDGDWIFVSQTSGIPLLAKTELIRAHFSLCSVIGERVWIKTPNLVPIGDYYYPTQQWQDDITRVLAQHKTEALIETHEQFLDLMSHVTQMSLGSDPNFQKIMLAQSEAIATRNAGVMMRE